MCICDMSMYVYVGMCAHGTHAYVENRCQPHV